MREQEGRRAQHPTSNRAALSPAEFAEVTGLNREFVYRAAAAGRIPHRRIGARILIPVAALDAWLGGEEYEGAATGSASRLVIKQSKETAIALLDARIAGLEAELAALRAARTQL